MDKDVIAYLQALIWRDEGHGLVSESSKALIAKTRKQIVVHPAHPAIPEKVRETLEEGLQYLCMHDPSSGCPRATKVQAARDWLAKCPVEKKEGNGNDQQR